MRSLVLFSRISKLSTYVTKGDTTISTLVHTTILAYIIYIVKYISISTLLLLKQREFTITDANCAVPLSALAR